MAIIGINTNKNNPLFRISDFLLWMPQYKNFLNTLDGLKYFNSLYEVANNKIFYSIFGTDWKLAMSYCIAHYLTLIANQLGAPAGSSLETIAGGGNFKGVLSSASIGDFSKSYDIDKTMLSSDEALFWNQTSYGASLMALYKTKAIPSMFVITTNPIPGATNCNRNKRDTLNLADEFFENYWIGNNLTTDFDQGTISFLLENKGQLQIKGLRLDRVVFDIIVNGKIEITYKGQTIIPFAVYNNKEIKATMDFINNRNEDLLNINVEKVSEIEQSYIGRFIIKRII